jgi:hypothetical protein
MSNTTPKLETLPLNILRKILKPTTSLKERSELSTTHPSFRAAMRDEFNKTKHKYREEFKELFKRIVTNEMERIKAGVVGNRPIDKLLEVYDNKVYGLAYGVIHTYAYAKEGLYSINFPGFTPTLANIEGAMKAYAALCVLERYILIEAKRMNTLIDGYFNLCILLFKSYKLHGRGNFHITNNSGWSINQSTFKFRNKNL